MKLLLPIAAAILLLIVVSHVQATGGYAQEATPTPQAESDADSGGFFSGPAIIIAAVGSAGSALLGGAGGFFFNVWRERRQAKSEFGAEVRGLFKERVKALHSARERQPTKTRQGQLSARLRAVENEYFDFLDGLLRNDPAYSRYIEMMLVEVERVVPRKDEEPSPDAVRDLAAFAARAERVPGLAASAVYHYALGIAAYTSGNYRKAVVELTRAIEQEPKNAKYFWRRGDAYDEMGRFKQALVDYGQALSLDKDNHIFLMHRGITLDNLGRYKEALTDYNKALKLRPDQPATLSNRGVTLAHLGRHQEAIADYDRALQLRPDNAAILSNRGVALSLLEQDNEALADFERAFELAGADPGVFYDRSTYYALRSRFDEAISDFRKAIAGDRQYQRLARTDSFFDNIRDDPRFQKLVGEDETSPEAGADS